jgi:hypothetical protein
MQAASFMVVRDVGGMDSGMMEWWNNGIME